ncbi:hypothetical protein DFH08DRAFT_970786 [Mycena albidolilacea]|uniref:Uncharacterized protein n=1 Tax=Mycena albidolilacea TaxID=1033008 RepID=A0AAD6ZEZ8_9AGAR|nr:hypothetical protein DFH08DRAFT_970786 [Mycena albidolilacea]
MPVPTSSRLWAPRARGAALDPSLPLAPSLPALPLLSALSISLPLLKLFPLCLLSSLASRLAMCASTLSESRAAGAPNRALLGDTHPRLRSNAASRLRHARCKTQAPPYDCPGPYRL